MNKVTIKEAENIINTRKEVLIILETKGVEGVHEYNLKELEDTHPSWSIHTIDILNVMNIRNKNKLAPLYFEPDTYPTIFIFKDKERKVVIDRVVTDKELSSIMLDVELDRFELVASN
jgi:hypothetical protein